MNRHIHDKIQVLTITDKQTSADKVLGKPKKICWSYVPFVGRMIHKTSSS